MQQEQQPKVIPVIDVEVVEVIETSEQIGRKNAYAQVPHRAAAALDSIADAIGVISPDRAADIRQKAQTARAIGVSVENVQHAGGAFLDSVKRAWEKTGIKFEMVNRREGLRR